MSITYPEDQSRSYSSSVSPSPSIAADDAFVPVYARTRSRKSRGGVRSWMILAPVGLVALGGVAAMMLTDDRDAAGAALAEPAAAAPVLPAAPAPAPAPTVAATAAPAEARPAAREAAPAPRRAPAAAPAPRAAARPAAVEPAEPAVPAVVGPTVILNTAAPEASATPTAAPPPQVVIAPQD